MSQIYPITVDVDAITGKIIGIREFVVGEVVAVSAGGTGVSSLAELAAALANNGTPIPVVSGSTNGLMSISLYNKLVALDTVAGPISYVAGTNSNVVASDIGITVTKVGTQATITVPPGVVLVSASIYFTGAEISGSVCSVVLPEGYGIGPLLKFIQPLAFKDVSGSKTQVLSNFNLGDNIVQFTGLTPNQGCAVNLVF